MKVVFSGLEDSGKSYKLAETAARLVERNADWLKITGKPRPIVSNLEFTPKFEQFARERGIPIKYWKDLEELPAMTNCDLFMDEVASYLDARSFKDLPLDFRLWLAQASKLGVDMYCTAQDFAQVDLAFRRLTTNLLYITKIAGSNRPAETKPPTGRVWGLCMTRELDPVGYDEQKKAFNNAEMLPHFFFIRREICEIFDTTKRIAKSKPPPFKHVVRPCADGCNFELYQTIGGVKHKIVHV